MIKDKMTTAVNENITGRVHHRRTVLVRDRASHDMAIQFAAQKQARKAQKRYSDYIKTWMGYHPLHLEAAPWVP